MRQYRQFCGVAKALDLVGERWTLLIIRELIPGPRRYGDLLRALPGLTTNLLATRLKHLRHHEILDRHKLPPPAGATVYALTDLGMALEPVVLALGQFGERYLGTPDPDDRMDFRWLAVSLRRRYHDTNPTPFRIQLHAGDDAMIGTWDGHRLRVADGEAPEFDVSLSATPEALAAVLVGRAALDTVTLAGDPSVARRLLTGLAPPAFP